MHVRDFLPAIVAFIVRGATALAEECDPKDRRLLLPDLQAVTPTSVRIDEQTGTRILRFSAEYANVGSGPLQIQSRVATNPLGQEMTEAWQIVQRSDGTTCEHLAGTLEFEPLAQGWRFHNFARFELRRDSPEDGELVGLADTVPFCLADARRARGQSGPRQIAADCTARVGVQGFSTGWSGVYTIELAIPAELSAGAYYMVNWVNADALLLESNDSRAANSTAIAIFVRGPANATAVPTAPPTATSTAPPGPTATPTISIGRPRPTRVPRAPRPTLSRPQRPTPTPRPTLTRPVRPTREPRRPRL